MRKVLVMVLSLAAMAVVASPASAAGLSGTYSATITGKPAPVNGKWQIRFKSGNKAEVYRNGTRVLVTTVSFSGNTMKITTGSGVPAYNRCISGPQRTGTYAYRLSGKRLTFTAKSDRCNGRKTLLTTKPYVKS
jgi:hypothetical protein